MNNEEDNVLQDIDAPVHKRSIRDIPIPNNRRKRTGSVGGSDAIDLRKKERVIEESEDDLETYETPNKRGGNNRNGMYKIGGVVVTVLILLTLGMNFFSSATISLEAKTESVLDADVTIKLTPAEEKVNDTQLAFQEISISKTIDTTVEASNEEMVQEKASGTITVYNLYSENTQTLIKNTRFESENGLIYRTPVGLQVPGYTEVDGNIVPGELEVEVVADEIGEEYNIDGEVSFTVPGFAGQDAYDLITAELTTPISGGYDGVRKVVSDDAKEEAQANLTNQVRSALGEELKGELPKNLIALYSEDSYRFGAIKQEDLDDNVKLSLTGTISAVVIDKGDLAQAVAQREVTDYRIGEKVSITNIDNVGISLNDTAEGKEINTRGDMEFIWDIDTDKLKNELLGKKEKEFKTIISEYRGVVQASVKFFPIWNKEFSDNPDKINIEEI